jgi:hypothetical protein
VLKEQIKAELGREPFIPLRLHLSDGKKFDVPFREVARVLSYAVLVFIGRDPKTRVSKGYDRFSFDQIVRIEQRPANGRGRGRKKAS